ncbi:MAG: hypothetical protein ABSG79_25300 [Bryobacteraceae bacterium]|jgi:hypothetical protein
MKVLVDRCTERLAVTHVTKMLPQTLTWGNRTQVIDVAQRVYRPPREDETFYREQIPYLASLCNSAKEANLNFFTSSELFIEEIRQHTCHQEGLLGIDLLKDVSIQTVQCPVQRGKGALIFNATREDQIAFFQSIQHPRYLAIIKTVGDAHLGDAFHLWTAEEASLDVFLTMDKRFWNLAYNQRHNLKSAVSVVTPKQLCDDLGLPPTDIKKLASAINPFS